MRKTLDPEIESVLCSNEGDIRRKPSDRFWWLSCLMTPWF